MEATTIKAPYRNEPGIFMIRTLRWEFVSADKKTHLSIEGHRFSAPTSKAEFVSNEGAPHRTNLAVRVILGNLAKGGKDLHANVELYDAHSIPTVIETLCRLAKMEPTDTIAVSLRGELEAFTAKIE